jgi:hypothetical protein
MAKRMLGDAEVGLPQSVVPVAGPAVCGGVVHHVGAHGVEFDVAHAGVVAVDVLNVTATHGLHEFGQPVFGFGGNEQVQVVGHEDVNMDATTPIGSRFL